MRIWENTGTQYTMTHAMRIVHHFIPYKEAQKNHEVTAFKTIKKESGWLMVIEKQTPKGKVVYFKEASKYNLLYGVVAAEYMSNQFKWNDSKF